MPQRSLHDFNLQFITPKDKPSPEEPPKPGFFNHRNVRPNRIIEREFQIEIAKDCVNKNSLVVLPTGLGKTVIAFMVMAELLNKQGRILFLAPTKPLVMQHYKSCIEFLRIPAAAVSLFSGGVSQIRRKTLWKTSRVVVATPQTIRNDLRVRAYNLSGVSLIVFDEAHRAVKDYSYVEIAAGFQGIILALTASPGGKKKRIEDVVANLKIENIQARSRDDPDVSRYVKDVKIEWRTLSLTPEMTKIQGLLQELLIDRIKRLNKMGFLRYKKPEYVSKKDIIACRGAINARASKGSRMRLFPTYLNQSMALQAYHSLELLETQGVEPLIEYLDSIESEKPSRAIKAFLNNALVREASSVARGYKGLSHPKLEELKGVISGQLSSKQGSKVMVFTQFRSTINSIMNALSGIPQARPARFVGQATRAKSKGLSQREQGDVIKGFEGGRFNVLVATSVAEEGLDIPSVDLVVFYEPIPSEIRAIQRRGRTGRSAFGRVVVLIARASRDEAYLSAEIKRERSMGRVIRQLQQAPGKGKRAMHRDIKNQKTICH
ncbi:hypothetical protein COT48_02075 [Candidatus Woesearchaeota archaeon CG08_land_8_20_14_0_20_47_9]|nr:MAG: hypothetical protein AUJ69_01675 [Candidatus Woesearchaeota archaeon CG1_02_47_18]PIN72384.1 MAG: hypothetical protein COV22_03335 [Candidatus Woesearchaeota archaeon CG10_big_fil_rev_8_21_14_0_10_47_5]PIO04119.1 MAG: hypothetical protein COT48_02075 [Candidatus Woesearchaeota archaeon CG08_land_8_20_14_0_20_47_9]HII29932.1 DEAD/DEAH box helicase family protein [Candidatus Woesearchaeota archaeon]